MNGGTLNADTIARDLIARIRTQMQGKGPFAVMEVCGTHTMEIGRMGLRSLLPPQIRLLSGPGCPVCVTPGAVIDNAVRLALEEKVHLCTFGDMIRVPGTTLSLEAAQAQGAGVEVVTSPLQALELSQAHPDREYVFIAVGFETTIPAIARSVMLASEKGIGNLSFLCAMRLVPPALHLLCTDPRLRIDGFLLPGHVSAIIGERPYALLDEYKIPGVITGFSPVEIAAGLLSLVSMMLNRQCGIVNRYAHIVKKEGNRPAVDLINTVFHPEDALWRGIGVVPQSGLALRKKYEAFDAARKFGFTGADDAMPPGCPCGAVLRGIMLPFECPLFGKSCTPRNPIGPCMVSSEGSCAAYHKYEVPVS